MKAQEMFDKVVNGLRAQAYIQSADKDKRCLYRGPNNLKCAAGLLLPDDRYKPIMEGNAVESTVCGGVFTDIVGEENLPLLKLLQSSHDSGDSVICNKDKWERQWREIAEDNNLIYTAPAE